MRLKPHVLTVASTATLRQIAEDLELSVTDKRKRQALIDAISSARRCQPAELLGYLGEPEVKKVCEAVSVDPRGRKNALIARLLEAASPTPTPAPASIRPSTGSYPKTLNHLPKRTAMSDQQPAQVNLQLPATEAGTTNVEKYEFQPIKGYPMLNWRGKRPFTSTQYFPAQLKEVHGEEVDGWRSKLFWGDNLQVMSHLLKSFRGQVDLVYIDPPFDSGADYRRKVTVKGASTASDLVAFEEKQYGDIWTNDEYLQFMYERFTLLRELLSAHGSIFVHCDPRRSHYLKLCLDEIFGKDSFVNEIIWKRSGVHASTHGFGPVHDVILFYSKTSDFIWNPQYAPYEDDYIEGWFKKSDEKGRKYGLVVNRQEVVL